MSTTVVESSAKPSRMVVSLQVGGIFFALANIVCVAILAYAWLSVRLEPKTLSVTGSAKKQITSDRIHWCATLTTTRPQLPAAYDKLKQDADRVTAFLKSKGVPEKDIVFEQIGIQRHFEKDSVPQPDVDGKHVPPAVVDSDRVKNYVLTQSVHVESNDIPRVAEVARSVTSLIKDDVEIDSEAPAYLYTKLSELKIDMLAEATKDATARATQIVSNANGRLGKLVEAKMGVIQINPKGSSATSAEGNNDTTSLEKEITAIVTARYELR